MKFGLSIIIWPKLSSNSLSIPRKPVLIRVGSASQAAHPLINRSPVLIEFGSAAQAKSIVHPNHPFKSSCPGLSSSSIGLGRGVGPSIEIQSSMTRHPISPVYHALGRHRPPAWVDPDLSLHQSSSNFACISSISLGRWSAVRSGSS